MSKLPIEANPSLVFNKSSKAKPILTAARGRRKGEDSFPEVSHDVTRCNTNRSKNGTRNPSKKPRSTERYVTRCHPMQRPAPISSIMKPPTELAIDLPRVVEVEASKGQAVVEQHATIRHIQSG